MRRYNINSLFTFGAIACFLAACSQEEAVFDHAIEELQTYTLYLDADMPNFDSVREGKTRASGNRWEDGDVIYIAFSNGGSTKVGNATYKSSLGAFQFTATSLNAISDASCLVYYFRGGSFSVSDNTVTMDKYTAIFADTNAKYTCSDNVITLNAGLMPYTWRLCFKGTSGTQVKLKWESILYNGSLKLTSGVFTTKSEDVNLQVQTDGYTPYVYGRFTGTNNTVKIEVGGSVYTRSISTSKLNIGQSGYFTIPTSSSLHGWTEQSGEIVEYEAIDLGLPSGTKWASWNVGATAPEEYGGYYAWGETEEKEVYYWSTYKWCNGSSDTMTKYCTDSNYGDNGFTDGLTELLPEDDAATANWGAPWHMPTKDQIKELKDKCTRMWTQLNEVNGMLVTGPNGNSIFLPATGQRWDDQIRFEGVFGYYWLSSLSSRYDIYADMFYITDALFQLDYDQSRFEGQSVRAVCP